MDLAQALHIACKGRATHRLRDLCNPTHSAYRPDYIATVFLLASRQTEAVATAPPILYVHAHLTTWTGYGILAGKVGRQLDRHKIPFRFIDAGTDTRYQAADPWNVARTVAVETAVKGAWSLQLGVPLTPPLEGHPTIAFTMWESDRLGKAAVATLNRMKAVIVPSQWNAVGFRSSGVKVPIHVVPLGVDTTVFTPRRISRLGKTITFGMSARVSHGGCRKGIEEGARAFLKAFPEHVRLEIKLFEDCLPLLNLPADPRITVVTKAMSTEDIARWYDGIDCLLVPSRAEGWGLSSLEAMACGVPVIAARYSGTAEFFDARYGWELPYKIEPASGVYRGMGNWAVPTEAGMVAALRAAYADPFEMQRRGEAAAVRAAEFTWTRTGNELVKVLRAVGALAPKPRGSLADAVKTVSECVPCQEARTAAKAEGVNALTPAGVTDVGDGVFVGNFEYCDAKGAEFALSVHIWSALNVSEKRLCRVCREKGDDQGLRIEYTENQPLATMSCPIDEVVAYFRQPGNVLIHCAAGACRSPTLAVLALAVRGVAPWEAVDRVRRATMEQRGFEVLIHDGPIGDITRWWDAEKSAESTRSAGVS